LAHQLHVVRAHLLHYESLLDDFRKTVEFVLKPLTRAWLSLLHLYLEPYERLLDKECTNLLIEISRLKMTRAMLNKRLGNVTELAFSSFNIEESRRMKNLTEISLLTKTQTFFGMNVIEITGSSSGSKETLAHYIAAAIPLTIVTVWVMM
ncbi:hypothetical protein BT96DRAFT_775971, partial [Gymnopus androsaceus JB14]